MKKLLVKNASQLATPEGNGGQKGIEMSRLRIIQDAAVYAEDGVIGLVGQTQEVLEKLGDMEGCTVIDAKGRCLLPGFVDSHTHFVFAGYRDREFLMRLRGAQYLEIMKAGGGIQNTVHATKAADEQTLFALGRKRLFDMLRQGVTTVEGKSGYGLDVDTEIKQLRVMRTLRDAQPVDIVSTYLGAHAVPIEYKGRTDDYIGFMLEQALPEIRRENLASFCDVFCEEGVFSIEQSKRLLDGAKGMGFGPKIHADEIEPMGGAGLAAELNAVSADHLLMVSEADAKRLSQSGTVATLLPATAFCLDKPYAPARKLIDCGCAVALASDFNPGSCFSDSIPLLFALSVIHMKMTIEEAITALTLNAAAALKRADSIGSIEAGKQADMVLLDYPDYNFLVYHTCASIVHTVIKKGTIVYENHCQ